jgi:hypothetical protein
MLSRKDTRLRRGLSIGRKCFFGQSRLDDIDQKVALDESLLSFKDNMVAFVAILSTRGAP